ncbi:hypothetical protein [Mycobacteroides abscessus]|uniref:hypothetical protein n=1 Tax=Mycobacteroides abscessus TaxID=36809 RepID=UPI00092CCE3E|nr:hypothetical protein [Mycobacteroides abscessus]SIC59747.1 Uncharacterised protein [Mycobacteroides abscessus subsp. abscessus]
MNSTAIATRRTTKKAPTTSPLDNLLVRLAKNNRKMAMIQEQIIEATTQFQSELHRYQETDAHLRSVIEVAMESTGTKSFENQMIKLTYVAPTQRKSLDTKRLEMEMPEVAAKYRKLVDVKGSVRITVK